jgi:Ran GTPase-activating protein (RanGAP) involved in mRNA processing and transport
MELYGCWCSPWVLAPVSALGLAAQWLSLREVLYPPSLPPLPRGEETQDGWAALPDELLARIFALVKAPRGRGTGTGACGSLDGAAAAPPAVRMSASGERLFATAGSPSLRGVCRAWRRVHDTRAVRFLKPCMLHTESLIARFPSLEALDLSRCKYPDQEALFALIGRLPRLHSLTLKDAGAGPRLAGTLADALGATTRLRTLNLSANGVGARGAASLADSLRARSCSLTALNLRDNAIPSEGALALAAALRHNGSLAELDLSANPLGHEGAVALSGALVHNGTLKRLNLGGCALGDDGAIALAQGLSSYPGLQTLSLYSNGITDAAVAELAHAAARNGGALRALELRGNAGVTAAGVSALAVAAAANPALREIHLDAPPSARPGAPAASPAAPAAAEEMAHALAQLEALLAARAESGGGGADAAPAGGKAGGKAAAAARC